MNTDLKKTKIKGDMTVGQVVREEAAKHGITLKDDEVEFVLWEKTGYPVFWPDHNKTPEENLRAQVAEWASEELKRRENGKKP